MTLGYNNVSLVRRKAQVLNEFPNLKVYESIVKACKEVKFDVAIICTPTSNHFKDFIEVSKNNIPNIYIEKPICGSTKESLIIEKTKNELNLNVVIGYDLHFDLGLLKVKELLKENITGKVCSFQVEVGQYLPDWRIKEDYREGMSAKRALGGGVMLDLIHEFDYVNSLFGPIKSIFGKHNHISNLEIETEDVSLNIVETKNGVLGTILLDYLQKELSRSCKIIGDRGTIIWNYKKSNVSWMTNDTPVWKEFDYSHEERNDRFLSIIKSFLESNVNNLDDRLSSVEDSIISLKMVETAKKSNITNKYLEL
jgi:predicted dehydrogenase